MKHDKFHHEDRHPALASHRRIATWPVLRLEGVVLSCFFGGGLSDS